MGLVRGEISVGRSGAGKTGAFAGSNFSLEKSASRLFEKGIKSICFLFFFFFLTVDGPQIAVSSATFARHWNWFHLKAARWSGNGCMCSSCHT